MPVMMSSFGPTGGNATDADRLSVAGGAGSQVYSAVWNGRQNPRPNLAVFHACSVFASNHDFSIAVGILDPNGTISYDRASAGFDKVVDDRIINEDGLELTDVFLSEHAKKLYAGLREGKTIFRAVDEANQAYRTAHSDCPQGGSTTPVPLTPMRMKTEGDDDARLWGVYTKIPGVTVLSNQDLPALPGGEPLWYFILTPLTSGAANNP